MTQDETAPTPPFPDELQGKPGQEMEESGEEESFPGPFKPRSQQAKELLLQGYSIILVLLLILAGGYAGWTVYKWLDDAGTPDRSDWAYEMTDIDWLNDQGLHGKGIIIGVIDTGLDPTHQDLKDINIVAWRDFINDRAEPYDDNGHGTHVTGIMAADGKILGGATKAGFIICKALDGSGTSEDTPVLDSTVAEAIDFCVAEGAHIISLSLGGSPTPLSLGSATERSTQDAIDEGVFVVAAAGNDGRNDDGDVQSPGSVDGAISVGSINRYRHISDFSSEGDNDGYIAGFPDPGDRDDPNRKPEFVAPGEMILSTYPGDKYYFMSGTSQAVPFVSSVLALLLERHPEHKRDGAQGGDAGAVENLKNILMNSADPCPTQETPHDTHYGYGVIDPRAAMGEL